MRPLAAVLLALGLAPVLSACSSDSASESLAPPAAPAPPAVPGAPAPPSGVRRDLLEVVDNGETSVRANLDLGLGRVTTGEAESGTLFQTEVALPDDRIRASLESETVSAGEGTQARVSLGLDADEASLGDLDRTRDLGWTLLFSHRTPLDLSLRLGAAAADLDLTAVPLRRLSLVCGVARTNLRVSSANTERADEVSIQAGVSAFSSSGLGNLRFRRFRFEGGVGRFALDFRGARPEPGAEATVRLGMGDLTVVLPDGVPIILEAPSGRMSSVELPSGLTTLGGNRYATPEAEGNPAAFRLRLSSGPGRVVVRIE